MKRKQLTNETQGKDVLAIVTAAIGDGTYISEGPARAVSHGSATRYIETGIVDDVRVQIIWDTTWDNPILAGIIDDD